MKGFDVAAEVRRFDPSIPIEEAWTPPASWYTAGELARLDAEVLLDSWQPVARVEQLADSGAYVSGCFGSEPFVVLRDGETLRAFHNVCRHKGHEVARGTGQADQLRCGYHGWSYRLDGSLLKAPQIAGVRDFDRATMSLPPMDVATLGPWVFVHIRSARTSLDEVFAPVTTSLDEGWTRLRFAAERRYTVDCNWKVFIDNYLDGGYHVSRVHPSLDDQIEMSGYRTEVDGRCVLQTSARRDSTAGERIGAGAVYGWVYPNFMINRYGRCLDSNLVIPRGPQSCEVLYQFYFDDPTSADNERSIAQSDVTQQEDGAVCESVQRGLMSSSYDRGRYAPQIELGEHAFHRWLAEDYRRLLDERDA